MTCSPSLTKSTIIYFFLSVDLNRHVGSVRRGFESVHEGFDLGKVNILAYIKVEGHVLRYIYFLLGSSIGRLS